MSDKSKSSHQDNLATAFVFTDEDLAANREGKLSLHQRTRVRFKFRSKLPGVILLLVVGVFPILIWGTGGVLFTIVAFITAVIMFKPIKNIYLLRQDLRAGTIEIVEGVVQLAIDRALLSANQGNSRFIVYVREDFFDINEHEFLAFKNGDPYRVYYLPHSRIIISVEWLNANPFE